MQFNYNTFCLEREIKMKRRKLKKGWVWLLGILNFASLMVMGGDSESMKVFIISKLIAGIIFTLTALVLVKYEVIYETK